MRKVIDLQMKLGETDIAAIHIDPHSRDEIPKLLRGLQAIWCNREIRALVFQALKQIIPSHVNPDTGRNGMNLWNIFVLATIRINCKWDYDKLQEIVNNHRTIRQMLGHSWHNDEYRYPLQTLKDNVRLLTPEALDQINQIVVKHGHDLLGGAKQNQQLRGSCDSFVVKTDVHFPTDINLLFDAIRKMILLVMGLCANIGSLDWRQGKHHIRKAKKLYLSAQRLKHSSSKDDAQKARRRTLIIDAHLAYLNWTQDLVARIDRTLNHLHSVDFLDHLRIEEVKAFVAHARRQMDQIRRRVVDGEVICHHEKVFSLFEQHTEWISKGKAGVPVELGVKVCIIKDQFNFILHHRVMQHESDAQIAVAFTAETKARFAALSACSYDKGFHSPDNQTQLVRILDQVVMPRKGRLSAINAQIERSESFINARRKHSAVESSIHALSNHGLDRCLDHGINGFKRYVALGIVARNLQILGHYLQIKEIRRQRRQAGQQLKAA